MPKWEGGPEDLVLLNVMCHPLRKHAVVSVSGSVVQKWALSSSANIVVLICRLIPLLV